MSRSNRYFIAISFLFFFVILISSFSLASNIYCVEEHLIQVSGIGVSVPDGATLNTNTVTFQRPDCTDATEKGYDIELVNCVAVSSSPVGSLVSQTLNTKLIVIGGTSTIQEGSNSFYTTVSYSDASKDHDFPSAYISVSCQFKVYGGSAEFWENQPNIDVIRTSDNGLRNESELEPKVPKPVCSKDSIESCTTQIKCESINGLYWDASYSQCKACLSECLSGESLTDPLFAKCCVDGCYPANAKILTSSYLEDCTKKNDQAVYYKYSCDGVSGNAIKTPDESCDKDANIIITSLGDNADVIIYRKEYDIAVYFHEDVKTIPNPSISFSLNGKVIKKATLNDCTKEKASSEYKQVFCSKITDMKKGLNGNSSISLEAKTIDDRNFNLDKKIILIDTIPLQYPSVKISRLGNSNRSALVCSLPWGGTINNGSSITAYQSSSVPLGSVCTKETRTCTNGILSGSYGYQSCIVKSRCQPMTSSRACDLSTPLVFTQGGMTQAQCLARCESEQYVACCQYESAYSYCSGRPIGASLIANSGTIATSCSGALDNTCTAQYTAVASGYSTCPAKNPEWCSSKGQTYVNHYCNSGNLYIICKEDARLNSSGKCCGLYGTCDGDFVNI